MLIHILLSFPNETAANEANSYLIPVIFNLWKYGFDHASFLEKKLKQNNESFSGYKVDQSKKKLGTN